MTPTAQADTADLAALLPDPCEEPGAINVVNCAVDNGEILVCNAVYGYDNCLPILYLDGTTSALAIGPCQDPGLMAVIECAEDNGEILVCNAVYGRDNCLPVLAIDTTTGSAALLFLGPCDDPGLVAVTYCALYNGEVLVCNAVYGYDDCIRLTSIRLPSGDASSSALALIGPCQDPGLVAVVYCARDNGEVLVCNAVYGTDDCIKKILASLIATPESASVASVDLSDLFHDPCDQPGLVAVAQCAVDNSEILVCNAVYGRDDCLPVATDIEAA